MRRSYRSSCNRRHPNSAGEAVAEMHGRRTGDEGPLLTFQFHRTRDSVTCRFLVLDRFERLGCGNATKVSIAFAVVNVGFALTSAFIQVWLCELEHDDPNCFVNEP